MRRTRILLAGCGRANAFVLKRLARTPLPGAEVVAVDRADQSPYTGMLPGWLAGDYARDEITVHARLLAEAAGARFVRGRISQLDPRARKVVLENGVEISFDLAVLNVGGETGGIAPDDAGAPVRPLEAFARRWAEGARLGRTAVLGAGAAGAELACALAASGRADAVTLIGAGTEPGDGLPPRARRSLARALARAGVTFRGDFQAVRVARDAVIARDGARELADFAIWAAGVRPPDWVTESGLAVDPAGFVAVDRTLRSVSHPWILAAGDVAAPPGVPSKAGVFAVRSGKAVDSNVRALIAGQPLARFRPQRRWLSIVGVGAGRGVAVYGAWSAEGRWAWAWKRAIDRAYIRRVSATIATLNA